MLKIIGIQGYTVPFLGNMRCLPYGDLIVTDGEKTQICPIKDDRDGSQYIHFRRKRYDVVNSGKLYNPSYTVVEIL